MFPVYDAVDSAFIPAGHGPTDRKQVRSLRQIVSSIRERFPLRSINLDKQRHVSLRVSSLVHWLHATHFFQLTTVIIYEERKVQMKQF